MDKKIFKICLVVILVICLLIVSLKLIEKSKRRDVSISTKTFESNISDEKVYGINVFLNKFYDYSYTQDRLDRTGSVTTSQTELESKLKNSLLHSEDFEDYVLDSNKSFILTDVVAQKNGNVEFYVVEVFEYDLGKADVEAEQVFYNIAYDENTLGYVVCGKSGRREDVLKTYDVKTINATNDNKLKVSSLTSDMLADLMFTNYKTLIKVNPEKAWDKLDVEYREKRFENYENFETYAKYITTYLPNFQLDSYIRDDFNYVIKDEWKNIYQFKVKDNFLSYTAILDEYTLKNDEFNKDYMDYPEEQRASLFVGDIISMINSKDYIQMYNKYLNSRYKQNFEDFNAFLKVANAIAPYYYSITNTEISKVGDIYKFEVTLQDMLNDIEKELTFLVEPTEDFFTFAFAT